MKEHMLREDWDFYHRMMAGVRDGYKEKAEAKYFRLFKQGYDQEQVPHRKANAGRFMANLWFSRFAEDHVPTWHFNPIKLAMPDDYIEWGKEHKRAINKLEGKREGSDFGDAAAGFAVERLFHDWLEANGWEHDWNPDPEWMGWDYKMANGTTVDIKTAVQKREPIDEYHNVLPTHQNQEHDWYLMADITPDYKRVTIVGYQTKRFFENFGHFGKEGEYFQNMYIRQDCHILKNYRFIPPGEWLEAYCAK